MVKGGGSEGRLRFDLLSLVCLFRRIPFYLQELPPAKRRFVGRRSEDGQTDRIMNEKFGSLDLVYRETHKVNGLVLRDRLLQDRRDFAPGQRLLSTYYANVLMEWTGGQDHMVNLTPAVKGESISDSLIQALECCAKPNPATRSCEPLEALLRHSSGITRPRSMAWSRR